MNLVLVNFFQKIDLFELNTENKLIYFVKKNAYEIQINNPSYEIMENICCKICLEENINLVNEKVIKKIMFNRSI